MSEATVCEMVSPIGGGTASTPPSPISMISTSFAFETAQGAENYVVSEMPVLFTPRTFLGLDSGGDRDAPAAGHLRGTTPASGRLTHDAAELRTFTEHLIVRIGCCGTQIPHGRA
jgi:hypothetical protein